MNEQFKVGEQVNVYSYETCCYTPCEIVRQVDSYVEGCHYLVEAYVVKYVECYSNGEHDVHSDVVKVHQLRKIK